jgi:hypothetical protein
MITFLKHKYLSNEEKKQAFNYWKNRGIKRISYFAGPISRAGNVKDLPRPQHKQNIVGCKSIWADEMLHIVEDGKIVLCCMDWKREVVLGDLSNESIYEIWNGKRKKTWEMITSGLSMPQQFLCRNCEESVTADLSNKVIETNIADGRENYFENPDFQRRPIDERVLVLEKSTRSLPGLPQGQTTPGKRGRSVYKWIILIFTSLFTFLYLVYFWLVMKLRNRVLLGGRRS